MNIQKILRLVQSEVDDRKVFIYVEGGAIASTYNHDEIKKLAFRLAEGKLGTLRQQPNAPIFLT
jgi:hypothetical protein